MPDDTRNQGLHKTLGIEFEVITADRVVIAIEVGGHLLQSHRIVHGGLYCTLVETAGSLGAAQFVGDRGRVVGVSNHTDFLRATSAGRLTATATPIHRGRSQQLWLVDIRDSMARLVARGEVRLQNFLD